MKEKRSYLTENRKTRHDYFFNDEIEAGIELQGWEVKAIKAGNIALKEAFISFFNGECFLEGMQLTPLKANAFITEEQCRRKKRLLMHKREILKLKEKVQKDGMTAIPYGLYLKNGLIKASVMEAKGKKNYDKRNTVAERDWNRNKERMLKNFNR